MTTTTDTELQQYIETALWSSGDFNTDAMLREDYGPDDIAPEALESMRADVAAFLEPPAEWPEAERAPILAALDYWRAELGEGQIGHDFWLTRNGHGAGFWDRFMNEPGATHGRVLTEQAEAYGKSYLYVGDDGKVYVS